jgi:phosphoserine aminotransferase
MTRVYNFSAGPATLPESVLRQAQADMLDWNGSGMGVMEMSHRGAEFMAIHAEAIRDLRDLVGIPDDYAVLFLQGGGLAENAIVPLNLLPQGAQADYVVAGQWSKKSAEEAARYGRVHIAADGYAGSTTPRITAQATWSRTSDAAYLHVCTNETIDGLEFADIHNLGDGRVPVVADMSSHILSRPLDITRFGAVYGGAQKNIGPAGLTIVIVRRDLLGRAQAVTPSVFNWQVQDKADSMYNTPPTWSIYVSGLVFKWLKAQGGLTGIEQHNIAKASLLYGAIDASALYENRVDTSCRSRMNVTFFLKDERLNEAFLKGAKARGLAQLKGHRVVGGMRASLYNAMPLAGVEALVAYMRDFERDPQAAARAA